MIPTRAKNLLPSELGLTRSWAQIWVILLLISKDKPSSPAGSSRFQRYCSQDFTLGFDGAASSVTGTLVGWCGACAFDVEVSGTVAPPAVLGTYMGVAGGFGIWGGSILGNEITGFVPIDLGYANLEASFSVSR